VRCLLAVGAPLAVLAALEGGLRVAGYGKPTELFIPDGKPGFYRTNPSFTAPYFPPQFDISPLNFRIARHKEPGHIRIFVLGESAVRGTPEPGFGFAAQLQAQLRAAYPGKGIEVYNLGIVAINSHVVYQAARQAAAFEPDLFVLYMGNNEVVGPYGPGSANLSLTLPLSMIRASAWVAGTRTGQLIGHVLGRLAARQDRSLEWHGMSTYRDKTVRGGDPRLEAVYRNYEANLADIAGVAAHAGIKVVLATVVANLRDSPPFASLHREGMTDAELERWKSAYAEGVRLWELEQPDGAVRSISEALLIDPEYADAHYLLGTLFEGTGDQRQARIQFLEALHWDALRFRPDARINAIARKVASGSGGSVVLVDSALAMGSDGASTAAPSGREVLLEHVHFNWEGNVRMGRMLAEQCAAVLFGPGAPPGGWLDGAGCADALGYTEFGRLRMLRQMETIRGKPPFTNQLTFGEDQVRYQREIQLAERAAHSEDGLAAARGRLEAALARDPENPSLVLRLQEVESESGHPGKALEWADRAMELEPRSPELLVRRARALAALQRPAEAQAAVLEALRIDPYDLPTYTALVEVLRKTGDFELGRGQFSRALAAITDSGYIRLAYADLLFFHGDRDLAVHECRAVLDREPENSDALGRLVSLYNAEGKKEDAFALMSEARRTQPLNYENNLGLARIYEERGDLGSAAECLQSAARSGPATAQAHLFIARHLGNGNRPSDALVELARARRVAVLMGDDALALRISAQMPPLDSRSH
jgi:tetratricopeptide (TPR) repeat protein